MTNVGLLRGFYTYKNARTATEQKLVKKSKLARAVKKQLSFLYERYVEQEREGAKDDEPQFVQSEREYTRTNRVTKNEETVTVGNRMDTHTLAMNFRASAKKMGYTARVILNLFWMGQECLWQVYCLVRKIDHTLTSFFDPFSNHNFIHRFGFSNNLRHIITPTHSNYRSTFASLNT